MKKQASQKELEEKLQQILGADNRSPEAFELMYKLYRGRVVYFFYNKYTLNRSLIDDMVHDTFLKASDAILRGLYKPDGRPPIAWLIRIARNVFIDELRRRKKQALFKNFSNSSSPDPVDVIESNNPNWVEVVSDIEVKNLLGRLINLLSAEEKEMIIMRYFSGIPFKEINKMKGLNGSTTRGQMRRSLIKLRKLIKDRGLRPEHFHN
jgi:RNA polymerase sigma factor (sigma-70 family)